MLTLILVMKIHFYQLETFKAKSKENLTKNNNLKVIFFKQIFRMFYRDRILIFH